MKKKTGIAIVGDLLEQFVIGFGMAAIIMLVGMFGVLIVMLI